MKLFKTGVIALAATIALFAGVGALLWLASFDSIKVIIVFTFLIVWFAVYMLEDL